MKSRATVLSTVICVVGCVLLLGQNSCARGYKPANELESEKRGPRACYDSCRELGMVMTAFVLVDRSASGCVCQPVQRGSTQGGIGAVAAGHVVLEAERAQQAAAAQQQQQQYQQRQQQQQQYGY